MIVECSGTATTLFGYISTKLILSWKKSNTVQFRLSTSIPCRISNSSGCNSRASEREASCWINRQWELSSSVARPCQSVMERETHLTCSVSCSSGELLSRQGTGALKLAEPSRALGRCRSIFSDAPR